MPTRSLPFTLMLVALLAASLACNAVTNLFSEAAPFEAEATAEQVITEPVEEDDIAATAEAEAEDDEAEAEATDETDDASEEGAGDDGATDFGDIPPDIPIMDGEIEMVFESDTFISYYTDASVEEATEFYKTEMPENGWALQPEVSLEVEDTSLLSFEKGAVIALVTVTVDTSNNLTSVLITLTEQ